MAQAAFCQRTRTAQAGRQLRGGVCSLSRARGGGGPGNVQALTRRDLFVQHPDKRHKRIDQGLVADLRPAQPHDGVLCRLRALRDN